VFALFISSTQYADYTLTPSIPLLTCHSSLSFSLSLLSFSLSLSLSLSFSLSLSLSPSQASGANLLYPRHDAVAARRRPTFSFGPNAASSSSSSSSQQRAARLDALRWWRAHRAAELEWKNLQREWKNLQAVDANAEDRDRATQPFARAAPRFRGSLGANDADSTGDMDENVASHDDGNDDGNHSRVQRRSGGGHAAFKSLGRGAAGVGDDDDECDDDDRLWLEPSEAAVRPRVLGMAFGAGYRYRLLRVWKTAVNEFACTIIFRRLSTHLFLTCRNASACIV
jgi:hypothetical protein